MHLKKLIKEKRINKNYMSQIKLLTNLILKNGKSTLSKKVLYSFIKKLKAENSLSNRDVLEFLELSLNNILVRFVLKRRIKGKVRQDIPVPILSDDLLYSHSIRNLLNQLRKNKGLSLDVLLVNEIKNAFNNTGQVRKNLTMVNKVVVDNRKFIK